MTAALFGVNAIGVYVLSGILATLLYTIRVPSGDGAASLHGLIYERLFAPLGTPEFSSLLFALTFVAVLYLVALGMYRRRIFLKV